MYNYICPCQIFCSAAKWEYVNVDNKTTAHKYMLILEGNKHNKTAAHKYMLIL